MTIDMKQPPFYSDLQGSDGGYTAIVERGDLQHRIHFDISLLLIRHAWDAGVEYEDLADGYGKGEGTNGDWSGIRDSSTEAKNRMLERALNYFAGMATTHSSLRGWHNRTMQRIEEVEDPFDRAIYRTIADTLEDVMNEIHQWRIR